MRDEGKIRLLIKMYRNTSQASYRMDLWRLDRMKTVVFETREQQALGLQYFSSIPYDTVFKFPGIPAGTLFHSRNVPEPFEIFFVSAGGALLKRALITPPLDTIEAPPGTSCVYEARPGVI
jgi:uncharacterized membrane protein (UPF0127 family)